MNEYKFIVTLENGERLEVTVVSASRFTAEFWLDERPEEYGIYQKIRYIEFHNIT